jgi:flavin-dependent dehydrogenase
MDPLLGEGIRHAAQSGRLAAQAIVTDTLSGYSEKVRAGIGRSLRTARWMARLFYRFTEPCYRWGIEDKRFVLAFVGMFAGEYGYPGLIRRFAAQVAPKMTRSLLPRI